MGARCCDQNHPTCTERGHTVRRRVLGTPAFPQAIATCERCDRFRCRKCDTPVGPQARNCQSCGHNVWWTTEELARSDDPDQPPQP